MINKICIVFTRTRRFLRVPSMKYSILKHTIPTLMYISTFNVIVIYRLPPRLFNFLLFSSYILSIYHNKNGISRHPPSVCGNEMDFERSFMLAAKDAKHSVGTSFRDGRWILFVSVQKFEARSLFWRTFDCARYEAVETCCPLSRNGYLRLDCFYYDLAIWF